ncbi:regulator of G-protein signaling 7-like [Tubulanus polymorphus]|uniref:regulator of G-protein signaling 7-like n=1 Tax=Tubulanus polymorphus TaxID=672921 RepID=UPI003DA22C1E
MVVDYSVMAHRYSKKNEGTGGPSNTDSTKSNGHKDEENANIVVLKKMEAIVERMQDEVSGVPVRTVKSFMSKIPSVFTGADLTAWMMKNLDVDDQVEALHLAHLIAAHGYFFPIDDHVLTVRNDNTYYRFQTPCFWLSRSGEPENTDYAVYLCKRTMQNKQRLELADYEAENLARLQKMFSRKWELIFMQAEAQAKVDKKRDKLERKVLDSQERAFWDVHRPSGSPVIQRRNSSRNKKSLSRRLSEPGCVNTTEADIKKTCRNKQKSARVSMNPNYNVPGGRISPSVSEADLRNPVETLKKDIESIRVKLARRRVKISKVADSYISYYEQYAEFDPFITAVETTNPWISDNAEFWDQEKSLKDIPPRRVKKWAFSIHELLKDPAGREQFSKFLDKEFSGENLKFWEACQELRCVTQKDVPQKVQEIYSAFLAPGAYDPVNVDSQVAETVRKRVQNNPDRYCFDEAEEHIFKLMKSDSYSRYLRSDQYKEFVGGTKKKSKKRIASEVRRKLENS